MFKSWRIRLLICHLIYEFKEKNTSYIFLKTFLSECILNWISIYICLQANKYVHEWMSEDSIFIENVLSRWKNAPKTRLYCIFFVYLSFGEEKKKTKMCNAALKLWAKKREIKETCEWRQRRQECTKESKIVPILKWRNQIGNGGAFLWSTFIIGCLRKSSTIRLRRNVYLSRVTIIRKKILGQFLLTIPQGEPPHT